MKKGIKRVIAISILVLFTINLRPLSSVKAEEINTQNINKVEQTSKQTSNDVDKQNEETSNILLKQSKEAVSFIVNDELGKYVDNLYKIILKRNPDQGGYNYWYNSLKNSQVSVAQALEQMFNSKESTERKTSNQEYINDVYLAMLERNADEDGKRYWLSKFSQGYTRNEVLQECIASNEFKSLCSRINVKAGNINIENQALRQYIRNLYTVILNRNADAGGFNYWYDVLSNHKLAMSNAINEMYNSSEYKNQNNSNEAYIESIYLSILGRKADQEGKRYWLNKFNNCYSRTEILSECIESQEFQNICNEIGVERGSVKIPNKKVKDYVRNTYVTILGRSVDAGGLEYWTNKLASHDISAAQFIHSFFTSTEFNSRKLNDDQFVDCVYKAVLFRESDKQGKSYWMAKIKGYKDRNELIKEFIKGQEFIDICNECGIKPGNLDNLYKKLIVIDPGHVGHDSGAVAHGRREADLNYGVAVKLEKQLQGMGYRTYMTRSMLHPNQYAYLNTTAELRQRTDAANNLKADLFISLHHDSGGSNSSGIWTFYSSWKPGLKNVQADLVPLKTGFDGWADTKPTEASKISKTFGQKVQNNLTSRCGYPAVRPYVVDRNLSVTVHTNMPSVLIELGFMTNRSELSKCQSTSGQQQKAQVIADTVKSMF